MELQQVGLGVERVYRRGNMLPLLHRSSLVLPKVLVSTLTTLGLTMVGGGCSDSSSLSSYVQEDEAGVRHLVIERDILTGDVDWELDAGWNVGGGPEGLFVDIAAATHTENGAFAVLDRFNKTVTLLGPEGRIETSFGREGDGPSEFRDPRDIVALGGQLLVWDLRQATFKFFTDEGEFIRETRLPEPGDMVSLTGRIDLELDDLSQRAETTPTERAVFLQIEDNERQLLDPDARGTEDVRRNGFVVAYDPALESADTLTAYRAPARSLSPAGPSYGPPIFSPRERWAIGRLGILHGSNDAPRLELVDFSGHLKSELQWLGKRQVVSPVLRLAHVRSFYREQAPYLPTRVRDQWDGNTSLQKDAAEAIVVADSTPVFSRIWLVGRCAAVAPFDPEDASDGVAQRLTFVDLMEGRVVGRLAFGEPGTDRLLWLSSSAILTKHVDSLGVQSVSYFDIPDAVRTRCDT